MKIILAACVRVGMAERIIDDSSWKYNTEKNVFK